MSGSNLILAGDGRYDFSVKYCTYSLLDTATNLIIHTETLKRSDVSLANYVDSFKLNMVSLLHPNMETEALWKALCFLKEKVSISEVVTDASTTVTALLGEITPLARPSITHSTTRVYFRRQGCFWPPRDWFSSSPALPLAIGFSIFNMGLPTWIWICHLPQCIPPLELNPEKIPVQLFVIQLKSFHSTSTLLMCGINQRSWKSV